MKMFFGNFLRALRGSLEDKSFDLLRSWFVWTFSELEKVDAGLSIWKKYFDK